MLKKYKVWIVVLFLFYMFVNVIDFFNDILDTVNKKVENEIYTAMESTSKKRLKKVALSYDNIKYLHEYKVANTLLILEPLNFYFNNSPELKGHDVVVFDYRYDIKEYEKVLEQCNNVAKEIIEMIPENSSDIEKAGFVHDELCRRIIYPDEYYYSEKNMLGHYLDMALLEGKAVCDGYAKAYKFIMNKLGFTCGIVSSDDHAWNTLLIDEKIYHVDLTNDDEGSKDNSKSNNISREFFLVNDKKMNSIGEYMNQLIKLE